jgi:hypothetical protein
MLVGLYRTKRELAQSIGEPLHFEDRSLMASEYAPFGTFIVVGPGGGALRSWMAEVTLLQGRIRPRLPFGRIDRLRRHYADGEDDGPEVAGRTSRNSCVGHAGWDRQGRAAARPAAENALIGAGVSAQSTRASG